MTNESKIEKHQIGNIVVNLTVLRLILSDCCDQVCCLAAAHSQHTVILLVRVVCITRSYIMLSIQIRLCTSRIMFD